MKKLNLLKVKLSLAAVCLGTVASAQFKPLAFQDTRGDGFYADYVGTRFTVTSSAPGISGEKLYTISNDGTGAAGEWGGAITGPLNLNIKKAGPDSLACASLTTSFTSSDAALIFRGDCEFGAKALAAQGKGAGAVIIVNNEPGGAVGMGAGAQGAGVTIPVFMISLEDGLAINAALNASQTVSLSVVRWGFGSGNDIGLLPSGMSLWHTYAIPKSQVVGITSNPVAYKALDGAFIANFGTKTQTNVKLKTTVSWTPTTGSATTIRTDSNSIPTFTVADSIWTIYTNNAYNLAPTGTGRYDVTYQLTSDSVDANTGDNTATSSFYVTDDIFSKGRYDFAAKKPFVNSNLGFSTPTDFAWGPMYYVAKGGHQAREVQFSVSAGAQGLMPLSNFNIFIAKWVDGFVDTVNAVTFPKDSLVESGELIVVGIAVKEFNGTTDSSGGIFNATILDADGNNNPVILEDNSWYWVSADVPNGFFLGCDGQINYYPRTFGRFHKENGYYDVYAPLHNESFLALQTNNPMTVPFMFPFDRYDVDSVRYGEQRKGLVPALPLLINQFPAKTTANILTGAKVSVYPNPAVNEAHVSVTFDKVVKAANYTVIDIHGRSIMRETHNNVKNDNLTINTSELANGVYMVIISADGKTSVNKFTVKR